jgi:hypothetical protein
MTRTTERRGDTLAPDEDDRLRRLYRKAALTQHLRPSGRARRANEPPLMRAPRRRARSGGSHSRRACAQTSVLPLSPCSLSSARPSVRPSPPLPPRPRAAHAAPPRCTRARLAPLAWPPERRRLAGWPSPPRRDRTRGRRARCPARESRACGRMRPSWRARRSSRGLGRRASVFQPGHARGFRHRLGHEMARPRATRGCGSQRCGSVVDRGQQLGLSLV